jgi:hypothetical protein
MNAPHFFHCKTLSDSYVDVPNSRITVVTMAGASIVIHDATAADTVISVKQRVFAANRTLFVRRQRLVYSAGPRGMDALADDETLGGAGVARDGTAELDVLLADLTVAEAEKLGEQVLLCLGRMRWAL